MTRKLLLVFSMALGGLSASYAQDPSVGGFVITPNPLTTGSVGTISASLGNGSATAIPQSANTTYTFNLPPNVGVTGISVTPTAPVSSTTNFTPSIGTYSPVNGTIVTLISNLGPVPGNADYVVTLNVTGVQPGTNAPVSLNAVGTGVGLTNAAANDNASSSITVTGPLPVALVSFTAKAQENRTVAIDWTTSLETNNKGFLVERSKDLKLFERVGEVSELAAMSNAVKNYHLVDQTPYSGTSYYRLTQTDLSGKVTAFPVASVVLREEAYGVYPNPVVSDGQFTLRLDEPETATVGFFGADGRPMSFQKTGVQSGNLLLKATGKLSAGIYVLTVEERGQTRQHRIVVQ
ncbi:T9SS type A sorting domain-containing protein [Spirosoma lituiforme]